MDYEPLPKIGKTYNAFSDGKIRFSRLKKCIITSIIPFRQASESIIDDWRYCVNNHYWMYATYCDYFIEAHPIDEPEYIQHFARTKGGEWFSMGGLFGLGTLDVKGNLFASIEGDYEEWKRISDKKGEIIDKFYNHCSHCSEKVESLWPENESFFIKRCSMCGDIRVSKESHNKFKRSLNEIG
ncbi:hypothetical protein N9137_01090 [Pseudomonadales bacterium]|nr:hypothetical protein [Pseudomonadales bacterium]